MNSNIPNGYLPFDLETALKQPERVVSLGGITPEEIGVYKTAKVNPVYAVVKGFVHRFTDTGIWAGAVPNEQNDLFLLPEAKVFYSFVHPGFIGASYDSMEKMMDKRNGMDIAIQKTTITGRDVKVEIVHTFNDGE